MKLTLALALSFATLAVATATPLTSVSKYKGKFVWIKLSELPSTSLKSLSNAKSIVVNITFPHDVRLSKDAKGNTWFTFIIADQGGDWKWHQITASAGLPVDTGLIKAGKYTLSFPAKEIPKAVLNDKKQIFSLGPNTSGLAEPITINVNAVKGL